MKKRTINRREAITKKDLHGRLFTKNPTKIARHNTNKKAKDMDLALDDYMNAV